MPGDKAKLFAKDLQVLPVKGPRPQRRVREDIILKVVIAGGVELPIGKLGQRETKKIRAKIVCKFRYPAKFAQITFKYQGLYIYKGKSGSYAVFPVGDLLNYGRGFVKKPPFVPYHIMRCRQTVYRYTYQCQAFFHEHIYIRVRYKLGIGQYVAFPLLKGMGQYLAKIGAHKRLSARQRNQRPWRQIIYDIFNLAGRHFSGGAGPPGLETYAATQIAAVSDRYRNIKHGES
jgi:hypothetical protein